MKCFVKGMLGALLVLISAAVVIPLYGDYRSRSETMNWLQNIRPIQFAVADNAIKLNTLNNSGIGIKIPNGLTSEPNVIIRPDGMILIHGQKYGQLVALIPELSRNKVTWKCFGGSAKDVPPSCRGNSN